MNIPTAPRSVNFTRLGFNGAKQAKMWSRRPRLQKNSRGRLFHIFQQTASRLPVGAWKTWLKFQGKSDSQELPRPELHAFRPGRTLREGRV